MIAAGCFRSPHPPGEAAKRTSCFSSPLFGCGICSVEDKDIYSRSRPGFRRRPRNADMDASFSDVCDAVDSRDWAVEDDEDCDEEDSASDLASEASRQYSLAIPELVVASGDGGSSGSRASKPWSSRPALSTQSTSTSASSFPSVDRDVEVLLSKHSDVFKSHGWDVSRVADCRDYVLNHDRRVRLISSPPGAPLPDCRHLTQMLGRDVVEEARRIMVRDGPLQQPLLDYLAQTGRNEHYDARGTENPAEITGAARMLEFNILETGDRVEAMKQAALEADLRRRAARGERRPGGNLMRQADLSTVNMHYRSSSESSGPSAAGSWRQWMPGRSGDGVQAGVATTHGPAASLRSASSPNRGNGARHENPARSLTPNGSVAASSFQRGSNGPREARNEAPPSRCGVAVGASSARATG